MPIRLVDGEALWRSDKLDKVKVEYRAEYANLIPLAEADGTFECEPKQVWSKIYSYNRPDMSVEDVKEMLEEFEKANMLIRKLDENGKVWGLLVGIERRLPPNFRTRCKKGKFYLFSNVILTLDRNKAVVNKVEEKIRELRAKEIKDSDRIKMEWEKKKQRERETADLI